MKTTTPRVDKAVHFSVLTTPIPIGCVTCLKNIFVLFILSFFAAILCSILVYSGITSFNAPFCSFKVFHIILCKYWPGLSQGTVKCNDLPIDWQNSTQSFCKSLRGYAIAWTAVSGCCLGSGAPSPSSCWITQAEYGLPPIVFSWFHTGLEEWWQRSVSRLHMHVNQVSMEGLKRIQKEQTRVN